MTAIAAIQAQVNLALCESGQNIDAILKCLLIAGYNPLLTLVYSIFLAGLNIGGTALQRNVGVPMQIADIIQCCITLFVSVKILHEYKRMKAFSTGPARGRTS